MRRFQLGLALLTLPVFALTLFVAGCGKDDKKDQSSSGGGGSGEARDDTPKGPAKMMESKGGVLKGKVTLKTPPDTEKLTKALQAEIDKKADQKDYCMMGSPTEVAEQKYRIGKNGNLGNVFVWVRPAPGTLFKVDKKQLDEAKNNPVKIRQPHCAFIPHCAMAFVEYYASPEDQKNKKLTPTGQCIEIHNDAKVSHNTKYGSTSGKNTSGNETIGVGKAPLKITELHADSAPMTLNCTIHTWMDGFIRLVDTPYHAITYSDTLDGDNKVKADDAKFGTYEIKNLPVGKVRVIVWHEDGTYFTKGGASGEEVDIKEGGPTERNFEK